MSKKLKELSGSQKQAVVGLACMIIAQANDGRFRTNDPLLDIVIRECFDEEWVGTWDHDYRHSYFARAAMQDQDERIRIVSSLDMETKYAFKNMMIDIIGDNAMMVLAACYIYKGIGIPASTTPKEESRTVERHTNEDDGTAVIEDPFYMLADVGAVRGENDKTFTLVDENNTYEKKVGANYDYWLSVGVCPVNGLVGYVDPKRCEATSEGKLCYLVCPGEMVIPVLDWGLEKISEWSFKEKHQNNRMLSCDRSGKLCRELREMKKPSGPTKPRKVTKEPPKDMKVIRFDAIILQRIEAGREGKPDYLNRSIRLTYTKSGSELRLEVLGVMQPRTARFKNDDGRILTYEDTSRPYTYYEIETEPEHNTIVRISIFQKNADFEDIEYRYTR